MSYGSWWVELEVSGFKDDPDKIIFDLENEDFADYFWFTENEGKIIIEQASDEYFHDSDEMLEKALTRLWSLHKATITGRILVDSDTGDRFKGEWYNDEGELRWGAGIDPADYTVDQLIKIQEYAEALKEEEDEKSNSSMLHQ